MNEAYTMNCVPPGLFESIKDIQDQIRSLNIKVDKITSTNNRSGEIAWPSAGEFVAECVRSGFGESMSTDLYYAVTARLRAKCG